jgi:excinuclease ABC subunit A
MQFLSDIYVTCPDCNGCRYKASTLEFTWQEKSIASVLDLTVQDAMGFFATPTAADSAKTKRLVSQVLRALQPLLDVGLGYLKLGQPLNTLSGGEAQRLKLCQLLGNTDTQAGVSAAKPAKSKLLILDEPTTGLHFSDISNLLRVMNALVDSGHSLVVIEHNLDVIKAADWILDLGPEAGEHGGQLVAQGPPELVAQLETPTAVFLRTVLTPATPVRSGRVKIAAKPAVPVPQASSNCITLRGARHHNLKNISLDIPRDQFVVISGLSGSGKSTLAFDILFAEGQRRFLDSMSAYARQFAEQLENSTLRHRTATHCVHEKRHCENSLKHDTGRSAWILLDRSGCSDTGCSGNSCCFRGAPSRLFRERTYD